MATPPGWAEATSALCPHNPSCRAQPTGATFAGSGPVQRARPFARAACVCRLGTTLTLAGVVAGGGGRGGLQGGEGGGPRAQGGYHLHHAGQERVCGAHGAAAFQHRPVRLLLDVHVRLHGHRLPAARGVDGDLLEVRAGGRGTVTARPATPPGPGASSRRAFHTNAHPVCPVGGWPQGADSMTPGSERTSARVRRGATPPVPGLPSATTEAGRLREDSLLDVGEDAQHVLVHLQALQQGCLAAENKRDVAQRPSSVQGRPV